MLILASQSPRRKELLESVGLNFRIDVSGIDESELPGEDPRAYVQRMSVEKGRTVSKNSPDALVISADTIVVLNGEGGEKILGKPSSEEHAEEILKALSGKAHWVFTSVSYQFLAKKIEQSRVVETEVCFRELTTDEISDYIKTGEPFDKAGAYGIQGRAAGFVSQIVGSYTNVVGLPLAEVVLDLRALGYGPSASKEAV